jgi:hypothetical protein
MTWLESICFQSSGHKFQFFFWDIYNPQQIRIVPQVLEINSALLWIPVIVCSIQRSRLAAQPKQISQSIHEEEDVGDVAAEALKTRHSSLVGQAL